MKAATWLIYSLLIFDHIILLLHHLHRLKAKEQTDFKLAVYVIKCVHESAPSYWVRSSGYYVSDLSMLMVDELWSKDSSACDSNPRPVDPKASVLV